MKKIMFFTSAECAPCKRLKEQLKAKNLDFSKVQLIDVDDETYAELVKDHHVTNLPTVVFLDEHGVPNHSIPGVVPGIAEQIYAWVK